MNLSDLPPELIVNSNCKTIDKPDKVDKPDDPITPYQKGLEDNWKVLNLPYDVKWDITDTYICITGKRTGKIRKKEYKFTGENDIYYFDDTDSKVRFMFYWFM